MSDWPVILSTTAGTSADFSDGGIDAEGSCAFARVARKTTPSAAAPPATGNRG